MSGSPIHFNKWQTCQGSEIRKSKMRSPLGRHNPEERLTFCIYLHQIPSKPGSTLSLALHSQKAGQAARLHHPSKHSYLGSWATLTISHRLVATGRTCWSAHGSPRRWPKSTDDIAWCSKQKARPNCHFITYSHVICIYIYYIKALFNHLKCSQIKIGSQTETSPEVAWLKRKHWGRCPSQCPPRIAMGPPERNSKTFVHAKVKWWLRCLWWWGAMAN